MPLSKIEFKMMTGARKPQVEYWPLGTTVAPNYGAPYGSGYVEPEPTIRFVDTTMHGSQEVIRRG